MRDEDIKYIHELEKRVKELEEDLLELVKQNKELRKSIAFYSSESYNAHLERLLDRSEQQNKRYREALEFYADEDTYKEVRHEPAYMGGVPIEPPYGEPPLIYYDNYGEKARKALEGEK